MNKPKLNVGHDTREAVDFVISVEGQMVAARGLQLIKKAIDELPEQAILGLVFGVVLAVDEQRGNVATAFSTDTMGLSWGLKPCIDAAIDEALHGEVDENAVKG